MKALITGASSGIGKALAYLLASKGISLIVSGRNQASLDAVAQDVGTDAILVANLEEESGRRRVIEGLQKFVPDLVINCAGFGIYGEALSTSLDEQVSILKVNGQAVLEITLEAARVLIQAQKKGVILNVSSVAGEHPTPGMSVYGASKSFVTKLSQALDTELAPKGVRVYVSCPGMVSTDFANRAAKKKIAQSGGPIMSPQFAAAEIWKQIERGKEKWIFSRYYRFVSWMATHIAPVSMVKRAVWRNMKTRL